MQEQIDKYLEDHREAHLEELFEFLRIPSVSADSRHRTDMRDASRMVADSLKKLGFDVEVCPTAGHAAVLARRGRDPDKKTVLIYGHYDVQPPEPLELWKSPPFEPEVRDGKIFARGATDDKGQIYAHIKGVEACLAVLGDLPVNVKFLIEGEEEVGSPNLRPLLEERAGELRKADAIMISDSSMFAPGLPALMLGLRGLSYIEVTIRGASHDLHSGLYGGAAPNPIHALSAIITSLHDEQGRVTVPGFYDEVEPLTEEERASFAALPFDKQAWLDELDIDSAIGDTEYSILERVTVRPTLDCNGIWGGYTGEGAKTVIASEAHAKISCRLVPNQDPHFVADQLQACIESRVPAGYESSVRIFHGGKPYRTSPDLPAVVAASAALRRVWDKQPLFTWGGGSIPIIADFKEVLGLDTVLMGLGLEDDRLHSPNEKFDVENYHQGIRAAAHFLIEFGKL